jgi:hypothetical protein
VLIKDVGDDLQAANAQARNKSSEYKGDPKWSPATWIDGVDLDEARNKIMNYYVTVRSNGRQTHRITIEKV